jgi:hypothetical protein
MFGLIRRFKQSDLLIASNVEICSGWTELAALPPLKPTKQAQYLIIAVDGYKRSLTDTRNQILLQDGTTANPDVVLVDSDGNSYQLQPSLLISSGIGYRAASAFSKGMRFPKVRIRSDKPFRASNIYWENLNLK